MDIRVRHILEFKGDILFSIGPDETVYDALRMMSDKDVGALLVMENDRMVGILSERDYARKVILVGKSSRETKIREIMSSTVHTIHPNQTVEEAMELMDKKHVRHLPVEDDDGRIIGMISLRDVVRAIIYKQRQALRNTASRLIY
ncbi:MAG: CBS domain-containing protein [Chloroflexi bacterium]|nr:CBS domain-containing protein [Chloroflexota bacterium]